MLAKSVETPPLEKAWRRFKEAICTSIEITKKHRKFYDERVSIIHKSIGLLAFAGNLS